MTQIPIFQMGAGSKAGAGGSGPNAFAGSSSSTPGFLLPDFGKIGQGFQGLQRGIEPTELQGQAVGEQRNLRSTLDSLLGDFGAGQRARINEGFNTAARNVTGGLQSRGFAGSSLNLPAQLGVERERQLSLGDLEDRLLGRRIESESGIAKNISDILFGSAGQATDLLGSLLASGGIGTSSVSKGQAPGGGGGGGSSGATSAAEREAAQRAQFQDFIDRATGGGGSGGGGSGGGGSGGGGGGIPAFFNNPFFDPGVSQPGGPEGELDGTDLFDLGPLQDPEAFARNQAELDKKNAELAALLAQSAAGTSSAISQGAALA